MWLILSRKRVTIVLTIAAFLGLAISCTAISEEPDSATLSYGIAGKVIVVDPGHGGFDPGTAGRLIKVPEKDITLQVSKVLAQTLRSAGAIVILTRTGDADLSDEGFRGKLIERKRQDLARRVDKANKANADMYLSIHINADPSPRWHGAQTFYSAASQESKHLAECVQGELVRILGNNHRKAKAGSFFIMEKTKMPAVIIEIGFLSNPEEERLLNDSLYQKKIAHAIMSGIAKYTSEER